MALWAVAACVALGVDRRWGEPPAPWHPVVWMGRLLDTLGRHLAPVYRPASRKPRFQPFVMGALAWCGGAVLVCVLALGAQTLVWLGAQRVVAWGGTAWSPVLWLVQVLLLGGLLKPLLAWRMLRDEVAAVEAALAVSLDQGRARLSWLCSRDVSTLSATQVRETALETLAENLNDSVFAPLFWFVWLGLPGAAIYRWANTADAMWGYQGERQGRDWTWAGKWAARADDVLSYLPARLTGLLLMGVSSARHWRLWRQAAGQTPSPNGGWPMAAMAIGLGVRLGKPGVYVLNEAGRLPTAQDTHRALLVAQRCVTVAGVGLAMVALGLGGLCGGVR